jgi:hypothetical protein
MSVCAAARSVSAAMPATTYPPPIELSLSSVVRSVPEPVGVAKVIVEARAGRRALHDEAAVRGIPYDGS